MILLKTNQLNRMVVTVSQNAELSNPEWLFSFTHIFSKERVTMILPNLSTHQERYDQFDFVEGPNVGIGEIPFPYTGQYNYAIWEQPYGSGNLDPALAYNKVESGVALLIAVSANTTNDYYVEYISNDEDDSNIIFAPDELNPNVGVSPTPTSSLTPTPTPTITQTETPTNTPTPSVTETLTPTPTPSITQTNTPTVTETLTPTPTNTATQTSTNTPTPSVTETLTPTITPTNTLTPSITTSLTPTNTPTTTITSTITSTPTPTLTPTITITSSVTPTLTTTPTPTATQFLSEYQTILTRANELGYELPSNSEQRRQNQLITDLKNYGVFQKLGFFYVFAQNLVTVGTPSFTFINWVTPANAPLQLRRTTTGDTFPSFVNYSGWSFNQNNSIALITPANPTISTVNPITALSGGSQGVYVMSAGSASSSGTNALFKSDNNAWNSLISNNSTAQWMWRGTGLTTAADLTGTGFRAGSISGASTAVTSVELYSGTTQLARTKSATDAGPGGGTLFINGTTTTRWFWTCGMYFSGIALTSTEMNDLNNAFETYLNTPT